MGVNVFIGLIFQPDMLHKKRTIKLIFFEELNKSNYLIWWWLIEYHGKP
jgi:hypothetical protein